MRTQEGTEGIHLKKSQPREKESVSGKLSGAKSTEKTAGVQSPIGRSSHWIGGGREKSLRPLKEGHSRREYSFISDQASAVYDKPVIPSIQKFCFKLGREKIRTPKRAS